MPLANAPLNARDNRLLNTIEMRKRVQVMKSYPYSMQIEVTTKCNFACIMCSRDKYHGVGENLTDDILDVVMRDIFPHCQDVIVSSFGEPLLYPKLPEIFTKIDPNSGLELGFFTNMVLMTEEMAELIVKSGVGYVNTSIDGATKETYEKIRRGGKWDQLVEKLELFRAVKKRLNSKTPQMNLCVVGSTLNVDEIPTFIEFAKAHGFDTLKYNHNMYVDDEHMDYMSLVHEKAKTVKMFRQGHQRAIELGMHTNFEDTPFKLEDGEVVEDGAPARRSEVSAATILANKLKHRYHQKIGWRIENTWKQSGGTAPNFAKLFLTKGKDYVRDRIPVVRSRFHRPPNPRAIPNDAPPRTCGNAWTHVHVKSDGLVYPCCFSDEVMGDLRKESFDEIWNGPKYQDLRRTLSNGKYWGSCRRSSCNWVEGDNSSVYGSEITVLSPVTEIDGSKGTTLKVRIANTGRINWETPKKNPRQFVALSYRMYTEKLELIDEGLHIPVPKMVFTTSTVDMELPISPVAYAGKVMIKIDMVHEEITWFGERGNNARTISANIVGVPFAAFLSSWKSAALKDILHDRALATGQELTLPIRVKNLGSGPLGGPGSGDSVTYHWQEEGATNLLMVDEIRTPIEHRLEPGEFIDMEVPVKVPSSLKTGRYWLEVDLNRQGTGNLRTLWRRALLAYPVKVARNSEEEAAIPEKKENGKPYLWEPRGQCVSNTGNKGIW